LPVESDRPWRLEDSETEERARDGNVQVVDSPNRTAKARRLRLSSVKKRPELLFRPKTEKIARKRNQTVLTLLSVLYVEYGGRVGILLVGCCRCWCSLFDVFVQFDQTYKYPSALGCLWRRGDEKHAVRRAAAAFLCVSCGLGARKMPSSTTTSEAGLRHGGNPEKKSFSTRCCRAGGVVTGSFAANQNRFRCVESRVRRHYVSCSVLAFENAGGRKTLLKKKK